MPQTVCARCDTKRDLHARGLCVSCYNRLRYVGDGALDDYPPVRDSSMSVDEVAVERTVEWLIWVCEAYLARFRPTPELNEQTLEAAWNAGYEVWSKHVEAIGNPTVVWAQPPTLHEDGTPEWYTDSGEFYVQYTPQYPLNAIRLYEKGSFLADWLGTLEEAEQVTQALSSAIHYAKKDQDR